MSVELINPKQENLENKIKELEKQLAEAKQ